MLLALALLHELAELLVVRSTGARLVLAEREHDGVDRDVVDAREDAGDDERPDEDDDDGDVPEVQLARLVEAREGGIELAVVVRDDGGGEGAQERNRQTRDDEREERDALEDEDADEVLRLERERVRRRLAEPLARDGDHDVRRVGDEAQDLLEAPDAARDQLEQDDHDLPLLLDRFGLGALEVLEQQAQELDGRHEEGPERDGARREPERAVERAEDRDRRLVLALARVRPVGLGDDAGDGRPPDAHEEEDRPEPAEEVVDAQVHDADLRLDGRFVHGDVDRVLALVALVRRRQEEQDDHPVARENEARDELHDGEERDRRRLPHRAGRLADDGDGELDPLPEEDEHEEEADREDEEDDSEDLQRLPEPLVVGELVHDVVGVEVQIVRDRPRVHGHGDERAHAREDHRVRDEPDEAAHEEQPQPADHERARDADEDQPPQLGDVVHNTCEPVLQR